jgi:hypothetical protein
MKKITCLFAFCFLLSAFCLNAQQTHPLPDLSFEYSWKECTSPICPPYEDFDNDYFYTLNSLCELEAADLTALKENRKEYVQHGNYSIQLKSGKVTVGIEDIFLPGMVGTLGKEFVPEFLDGGSITVYQLWEYDTPHFMEGYYRYDPKAGDSAYIEIGFANQGVGEIFSVKKMIYNTVNQLEKFSLPIPKEFWGEVFDEIKVLFVASAAVNWENLKDCRGQYGSTLWVDNVTLEYRPDGIKQNIFSTLKTNAFPNPTTEVLNIELNEDFAGKVVVYNLTGSKVLEENINGTQCQLNTSALATGNYVYKLMNDNTIFAQGKFVVTK